MPDDAEKPRQTANISTQNVTDTKISDTSVSLWRMTVSRLWPTKLSYQGRWKSAGEATGYSQTTARRLSCVGTLGLSPRAIDRLVALLEHQAQERAQLAAAWRDYRANMSDEHWPAALRNGKPKTY